MSKLFDVIYTHLLSVSEKWQKPHYKGTLLILYVYVDSATQVKCFNDISGPGSVISNNYVI